jgi:hypothetical protein
MEPLEKNIRLFKKMKELASRQQFCLDEDRLDTYFELSKERDQLRSRITLNEKRAGSLATGSERGMDPAARKDVTEMVEVIRLIQEIDEGIRQTLIRKKEFLASEIREMRKGQAAVKSYGNKSAVPAKFIDSES